MENTFDKTAVETIDLLEARLRRIEYAVCGQVNESTLSGNKTSAARRLAALEYSLHQLASKSRVVQELLRLHSRHPDLFQSLSSNDLPTTLDAESLLSIIMASASTYPATASRLTSILDVPVPPAELSAQLIDLQPRIAKVEALQAAQNADIAQLRERSAAVIQRWYTVDILRAGESWAELEGRVEQVEQKVRRTALAKRLDDDMV
ncbi:uncharacterized protein K444DRAFT_641561 [Hyaloscypha bicolor E]|uniref:Nuclear distribution protein RO10 n=1 Tax=Hyaloscypha bicolor E TaxID=1095630 RepID=A0A2J6TJX4_9HELO|nr:uncharacterized protein K444DRAFT_641561 [Hyaloscypha bicolor E]PMD63310.1 hypothetical protein K444DRAFT_641561 [Hyaloscypha bicolor E]